MRIESRSLCCCVESTCVVYLGKKKIPIIFKATNFQNFTFKHAITIRFIYDINLHMIFVLLVSDVPIFAGCNTSCFVYHCFLFIKAF